MFLPFQIDILKSFAHTVCWDTSLPKIIKRKKSGKWKIKKSMIKKLLGDIDIISFANKENIIFPERSIKTWTGKPSVKRWKIIHNPFHI